MALAELASAEDAGAPVSCWEPVDIKAPDLGGLACSWFNELMRDAGVHRAELVDVAVDAVMLPADGGGDACRLQGRVGLRRLFGHRGPARYDLRTTKEAVSVDLTDGIWSLRAHLGPREDPSCLDGLQRADATDPSQPVRSLGDSDTGHRT